MFIVKLINIDDFMVGATSGDGRGRGSFYRYGHLAVHKFSEGRAAFTMEAAVVNAIVDGITASLIYARDPVLCHRRTDHEFEVRL